MGRRRFLAACAGLALAGCLSLGSTPGFRVIERLVPGMTYEDAVSIVSADGTLMSTSEFTKGPDGSWVASPGSACTSASSYKADESAANAEARTGQEVVKMVLLDRSWGWMGWDVFALYLDAEDRLVERDFVHLD